MLSLWLSVSPVISTSATACLLTGLDLGLVSQITIARQTLKQFRVHTWRLECRVGIVHVQRGVRPSAFDKDETGRDVALDKYPLPELRLVTDTDIFDLQS